jgi:hypothetical protein
MASKQDRLDRVKQDGRLCHVSRATLDKHVLQHLQEPLWIRERHRQL